MREAREAVAWAERMQLWDVEARIARVALYSWDAARDVQLFRIVESRML
jgi:hypothetical protein